MRGERTLCRSQRAMTAEASAKCRRARATKAPQASPNRGCDSTLPMSSSGDAGIRQHLLGKIEPAHLGVLIEVAQDIGHLQGAAEMMREHPALLVLDPEDLDRKPPDRRGDPVAIEIERLPIGGVDVATDVHLHAGDDGEEILLLQAEGL